MQKRFGFVFVGYHRKPPPAKYGSDTSRGLTHVGENATYLYLTVPEAKAVMSSMSGGGIDLLCIENEIPEDLYKW